MVSFRYSVVIPTYNRLTRLTHAIDSVLAQTIEPLEIIVVDDGSTDGTADNIAAQYPDVILLVQDNAGVSNARNRGIAHAQGDWVAFLDSDDTWLPKKIERQCAALYANPGLKICHTEEIWIRNGVRVNQMKKHAKSGGWLFEKSLKLCCISPSSVLLNRGLFERYGVFDEALPACEDYDLWLRLTAHEETCFVSVPSMVKYGGHEDQLSRAFWGMDRFRIHALEKVLTAGRLTEVQRQQATRVLVKKLKILLAGAEKRDNQPVIAEYGPKFTLWSANEEAR